MHRHYHDETPPLAPSGDRNPLLQYVPSSITLIPLFIVVRFWYIKKVNEANNIASAGQEVKIVFLIFSSLMSWWRTRGWLALPYNEAILLLFFFFQIDGGKFTKIKNSPLLFLAVILKFCNKFGSINSVYNQFGSQPTCACRNLCIFIWCHQLSVFLYRSIPRVHFPMEVACIKG